MANRRKFLAGLGALASGSAAAIGTGAFTSVSADRSVDVNVAGDAAAYLRLEGTGGNNSEYVTDDGNGGQLEIDLTDTNDNFGTEDPNGVNPDAVTQIDDLFVIQNQGTQEVDVGLTKSDPNNNSNESLVTFYATNLDAGSSFDRYSSGGTGNTVALGSTDATLGTGDSVTVSVEIDTEGSTVSPGTQILDSVTINGDAN